MFVLSSSSGWRGQGCFRQRQERTVQTPEDRDWKWYLIIINTLWLKNTHRDKSQCAVWVIDVVSEELVLGLTKAAAGGWEEDYDRLLLPVLDKELPCYILFRLDSTNSLGHEWIFIAWSPDHSPVRDRHDLLEINDVLDVLSQVLQISFWVL